MFAKNREAFQGLILFILTHWQFFAGLFAALFVMSIFAVSITSALGLIFLLGTAVVAYFIVAAMIAAFWVFDLSELFRFSWLERLPILQPRNAATFFTGIDESTEFLAEKFPNLPLAVFDLYDPTASPDPVLEQVRGLYPPPRQTIHLESASLPLPDQSCDAVFALVAFRHRLSTVPPSELMREWNRILVPGGVLLLVEPVRVPLSLALFGPITVLWDTPDGWKRRLSAAGFQVYQEEPVSHVMRAFIAVRPA